MKKYINQTAEIPGFQAGFTLAKRRAKYTPLCYTLANLRAKYSLVQKCGVDLPLVYKGYPGECRIIGRPSIRSCEHLALVWNRANVPLWKNAEGIFPVSYDTGLIEKETPGACPEQFDRLTTEARRRISPRSFIIILAAVVMTAGFILSPISASAEDAAEGDQKSEAVSPYVELYNQGIASLSGGDAVRAKALFEEAAGLAPDDPGIMRALIETDIALSADDNALQKLVNVLSSDKFDGIKDWAAIEYYKLSGKKGGIQSGIDQLAAIENSSGNLYLQRAIAEGYVRLRQWDKVAAIYAGLVQSHPGDPILTTRLVDAYMLEQNYEAVIVILEPQVAADPENTGISDVLARAYVGAKKSEQAVALYKQKIAKNPSSPGLRGRYAQALLDLGMTGESLAEWQEASKLDGKNFLFKQRTAETYAELGRTREAKSEYNKLLNLIPEGQADFKKYILARIEEINKTRK